MSWLSPTHHSLLPHGVNAHMMDTRGRHGWETKGVPPEAGTPWAGGGAWRSAGPSMSPGGTFPGKIISCLNLTSQLYSLWGFLCPRPWGGGASWPQLAWGGNLPTQVTEERFREGGRTGAPCLELLSVRSSLST